MLRKFAHGRFLQRLRFKHSAGLFQQVGAAACQLLSGLFSVFVHTPSGPPQNPRALVKGGGSVRDYEKMLMRIAALLLSLATLAECASNRARPVRWLVLWILQRAEAVASAYVADTHSLAVEYSVLELGDGRDEAVRLATTFRIFAAMLVAQAHQVRLLAIREPSNHLHTVWLPGCHVDIHWLLCALARRPPRYADSS